jgi:hypothetical protein
MTRSGCHPACRPAAWLLDAIHEQIQPLEGYRPTGNRTRGELMRRARLGA